MNQQVSIQHSPGTRPPATAILPDSLRRTSRVGLQVAEVLAQFIETRVLPGTQVGPEQFWSGLQSLVERYAPRNRELLARRDALQEQIDSWLAAGGGQQPGTDEHKRFLGDIGYLVPEPAPFEIQTANVDAELATTAAPQLVVPVTNPRYVLNAINARWGSLYDALYGTDAIDTKSGDGGAGTGAGTGQGAAREAAVITRAKSLLDMAVPLARYSHKQVSSYRIEGGRLLAMVNDERVELAAPRQFMGFRGPSDSPQAILLTNHNLKIEVVIDRTHRVGASDPAGVADVVLESAVSTIVDFEDSVATVDASDKVAAYEVWLGVMQGTLTADLVKRGRSITRRMNDDRLYKAPDGAELSVPGRALLLVRNVGLHMYTDAVLDAHGQSIPEGLLDACVTSLIALHDLNKASGVKNSRTRSIYIVKPKLHGPEEVAFAVQTLAHVEEVLGLPARTIKIGLMDEERRTSANLAACIHAARERLVFINTGFLDRTGDEIHTGMVAGPVVRKSEMRQSAWLKAYEERNVRIGVACGLRGKAQIGKGMWAAPDRMADMLEQKIAHPQSGATTAWVPSPTAATLHAIHYHLVDSFATLDTVSGSSADGLAELLTMPLATRRYSAEEVQQELDNNVQGILGYVVRWIDQGIGCSKVPDIHNVGLMEDRATLRISSQHIANWLLHGIVSEAQVRETLARMAALVDQQNAGDAAYTNMAPDCRGVAFQAAAALIFDGCRQPNGYTEFILGDYRRLAKSQAS